MNKFIIQDGLPYLFFGGKAYQCRWDSEGFTVGAEVEMTSAPTAFYSELSIKAQCVNNINSMEQDVAVKKAGRKKKASEE